MARVSAFVSRLRKLEDALCDVVGAAAIEADEQKRRQAQSHRSGFGFLLTSLPAPDDVSEIEQLSHACQLLSKAVRKQLKHTE